MSGAGGALPISACIIAGDEERNIRGCLESVAFCRERIVVDSHSADGTREIARSIGARVIERDWPGHIEQKNFALEQAQQPWALSIDADERVSDAMREAIAGALADGDPGCDGFEFRRLNRYLGRWIRHCGWYPEHRLRMVRRGRGRWAGVNPHDHLYCEGPVRRLEVDLLHEPYRDLGHHVQTINLYTTILAREKLKRGQRLVALRLLLAPPFKLLKMYVLQRGFLDGWQGLICSLMGSWYVLLKYAKLWELLHVCDPEAERAKSSYAPPAPEPGRGNGQARTPDDPAS